MNNDFDPTMQKIKVEATAVGLGGATVGAVIAGWKVTNYLPTKLLRGVVKTALIGGAVLAASDIYDNRNHSLETKGLK